MTVSRDDQGDACVILGSFGNVPLQVMRWTGQRESLITSPTSQRMTIPAGATMLELTGTQDCFIAFGGAAVDATVVVANDASRFFLAALEARRSALQGAGAHSAAKAAAIAAACSGVAWPFPFPLQDAAGVPSAA